MVQRKVRRSREEHWRRMMLLWVISLFFLMLFVVLDIIYTYNIRHPENYALTAEVDYSKIHFEGLALGDKIPTEATKYPIVDAEYDYSWNNVSITIDNDNNISRLGFYTIDSGNEDSVKYGSILLDYRGYPLNTISDYIIYFGYAKITNFRDYKYLDYEKNGYHLHLEILKNELYNVELYKDE